MFLNVSAQRLSLLALALSFASGCASNAASNPASPSASPLPASPSPVASPVASPAASPAPMAAGVLNDARDIATGAIAIAQSARSPDDWKLVASQWQRAIDKLLALPESHPEKAQATDLIAAYRRNLAEAEAQIGNRSGTSATSAAPSPGATVPPPNAPSTELAQAPAAAPQDAKVALAQHLQRSNARLYGTYWCSSCKYQKNLFGAAALEFLTEVECDPRGSNPQPELCKQKGVRAYPTWEINGQLLDPGALPLERLADLSGYAGPRNF